MSQASTITLEVNEDNDDGSTSLVTKTFDRKESYNGRSLYTTNASTSLLRETLGLYATDPKPSGNILGTSKASVKTTLDVSVPGADGVAVYTRPLIWEVSVSVPLGATDADILAERMKMVTLLMDDSVMDQLVLNQRT